METPARRHRFEVLIWIIAIAAAFAIFIFFVPNLFRAGSSIAQAPSPTATKTQRPTLTPLPPMTVIPPFPPAPRLATLVPTPTLVPGAVQYTFVSVPNRTGWIASNEAVPHFGERNLYAGVTNGETFQTLLYFDMTKLPPGSKILYADLTLYGLSRAKLGATGTWVLQLLDPGHLANWATTYNREFAQAAPGATIGRILTPLDLTEGQANQFLFATDQLALVEKANDSAGGIAFRMDSLVPGARDSLFAWQGGEPATSQFGSPPVLNLVAIPGPIVVAPHTPQPGNIQTAVAQAQANATRVALEGTPTPFPRNYATVTPQIIITPRPTALNEATQIAEAIEPTLIALTIGTLTPTPPNWITATPLSKEPLAPSEPGPQNTRVRITPNATPTSLLVPTNLLTPVANTAIDPNTLLQVELPSFMRGNIVFLSNRYQVRGARGDVPIVIKPDGVIVGVLSGKQYYAAAAARESYSPDRRRRAIVAPDSNGIMQIWIHDLTTDTKRPITHQERGIAYDPVWSPNGLGIAYVSDASGIPEIYVYDLASQTSRKLTTSPGAYVFNQHPSWSPNGDMLVFKSNIQTADHFQIWVMNADGTEMRNLNPGVFDDIDPIWVKQ